jgi:hypothetical protein
MSPPERSGPGIRQPQSRPQTPHAAAATRNSTSVRSVTRDGGAVQDAALLEERRASRMSARTDEMLHAALSYIARGWLVFVLSASKAPVANCEQCAAEHVTPRQMEACRCLCCHGFYAATLVPDRVAEMIRLHPRGLLAVRAGAPSGIAVADVDRRGIPAMRKFVDDGLLPRTVAAQTGGGGYHFVYTHPGVKIRSGANKYEPGIDSKADGGYIVVAPSVHPQTGRPYHWLSPFADELTPLPQHWVDILREPEPRPSGPVRVPARTGSRYAEAALRDELDKLMALEGTEGTRNDELNRSAFALGQLAGGGALDREGTIALLEKAGERIGLRAGEVRLTVASGMRAGAMYPRGGAS